MQYTSRFVSSTRMSDPDSYAADSELEDFVVDDEPPVDTPDPQNDSQNDETENRDRIRDLTTALQPNETPTLKLLRAHISVLVTALGGPDHVGSSVAPGGSNSTSEYKLGHDALACLKDIKRWIKSVDEIGHKYDVALACADCGLVENDLTVMLCQWDSQQKHLNPSKRTTEKTMLSALEILVLLTWPVEMSPDMSENQQLNFVAVRKSQLVYKKHILSYNNGQTFKAVLRLALPTISKDTSDREPRDNAILGLVLFFIRNMLYIEPPSLSTLSKIRKTIVEIDNMPANMRYDDVSINTVLSCFKRNKVLLFLLTMCGSLGLDFDRETFAPCCLECIFLIVRGVDARDLVDVVRPAPETNDANGNNLPTLSSTSDMALQDLLKEEKRRKKVQSQNISTRHGRFGTLLSLQGDNNSYVVSGQEALSSANQTFAQLDKSKKWNDRKHFKYDSDAFVNTAPNFITSTTILLLKEFINEFLVGGCFNSLMSSVGWIFSGALDLSYINEYEKASYFLTTAWFFAYKRARIEILKNRILNENEDTLDYGSVAAGLSEVNFVLIIGYVRESFERHYWDSLHVAMICFREMLLISNSVFESKHKDSNSEQDEEDRDMAEGIIRKLFSLEQFVNLITHIPQSASKHSPDYLSVCVSVVYILLKSFENFSKEDIKLYVQSKRKQRRNAKHFKNVDSLELKDIIDGSDEEIDEETVKQVSRERKFDFNKTEMKFFQSSIVTAHIDFLSRYEDLTHEQIKQCLVYFHRLFIVRKDYLGLFRLDFLHVLNSLRDFLPRKSNIRNHVEEFTFHFMKRFKSLFRRFPNPVELLFPRMEEESLRTYLTLGEIVEKPVKKVKQREVRYAKELEFTRSNFSEDEKYKILISAIYFEDNEKFLSWLVEELSRIVETAEKDSESSTIKLQVQGPYELLVLENSNVRFLLENIGFVVPESTSDECMCTVGTAELTQSLEFIKKWLSVQPVTFDEDKDASHYLRVRDDADNGEFNIGFDENEDEIAFETAPTNRYREDLDALDNLEELEARISGLNGVKGVARKKRRPKGKASDAKHRSKPSSTHRKPRNLGVHSDDEEDKPLKSGEYVHDSDDESDNEDARAFFEREEKLRRMLTESGGIVNPQQLEEFKKAWGKIVGGEAVDNVLTTLAQTGASQDSQLDSQPPDSQVELQSQVLEIGDESKAGPSRSPQASSSEEFLSADEELPARKKRRVIDDSDEE